MHTILFINLANDLGRYACYDGISGYIGSYHSPRRNNCSFTDCDTTYDCGAGADPAIVLDCDSFRIFQVVVAIWVISLQTFLRNIWMIWCSNGHVGTDPYTISQFDFRNIQECTIVIHKAILSHFNIHTILTVERCENTQIFSYRRRNQSLLGLILLFLLVKWDAVKLLDKVSW